MGLFENAVMTARSAAKTVGKKAEEVLDLSKRKLAISELDSKLEDAYCALGEVYYRVLKEETLADDDAQKLVSEIDEIKSQIETEREELAKLTKKSVCPACGADCDENSSFCGKCGARLSED